MRVILEMDVPDALGHEMKTAAQTSQMTVAGWAAQVVEAEIASRRLPGVKDGRCGPRIAAARVEDPEPDGYPVRLDLQEMELEQWNT